MLCYAKLHIYYTDMRAVSIPLKSYYTTTYIQKATYSPLCLGLLVVSCTAATSHFFYSSVFCPLFFSLDPVAGLKATHWDSSLKIWCPWHTFPTIHLPRYTMSNISQRMTKLDKVYTFGYMMSATAEVDYVILCPKWSASRPAASLFLAARAKIRSLRSAGLD